MNIYIQSLYRRGFLFTDFSNIAPRDDLTKIAISAWKKIKLGKYELRFDQEMNNVFIKTWRYKICILGLVLNPCKH